MGRIVVSQNITLDGVVEDPTGEEGSRHGGWFERLLDGDREAWAQVEFEEALAADALLLGRRSDEYFGRRWSGRSGDWADRLNSLPKYVISSTLGEAYWDNSTILRGDVVEEVAALKTQLAGEIVVYASRRLVQSLLEHRLVDEVRLIVFPVVLGAGERLFADTNDQTPLKLVGNRPVGNGLVQLVYAVQPS